MTKKKSNKQRSTKHTHKTKDEVTRTPLKPGGELRQLAVPAPLVTPVVMNEEMTGKCLRQVKYIRGQGKLVDMYWCVRGIYCSSFYDFDI
jgi:hypothetical protein